MMLRNWKPGPPESFSCSPGLPAVKSATEPAHSARFVPEVLFSKASFNTACSFVSTGSPVTRYLPLLPTVPVIVIILAHPLRGSRTRRRSQNLAPVDDLGKPRYHQQAIRGSPEQTQKSL